MTTQGHIKAICVKTSDMKSNVLNHSCNPHAGMAEASVKVICHKKCYCMSHANRVAKLSRLKLEMR